MTEVRRLWCPAEIRADDDGLTLRGVAAVFNQDTRPEFAIRERIERGAFRGLLANPDLDVPLLLHHDQSRPLARTPDSLELRETAQGLEFAAHLPDTSEARDTVTLVRSRVLRHMSIAWTGEQVSRQDGVRHVRSINRLIDISVVTRPAYLGTSVRDDGKAPPRRDHRRRLIIETLETA